VTLKVKVDEDLPTAVTQLAQAEGYDTASVLEQGMGGWKDLPLWRAIQSEDRFLITGDKGFGDIRAYPPGTHAGVLILRPDEDGVRPMLDLLQQVLARYRLNDLSRSITVATLRGIRIRRARRSGSDEA
jgi:predicted nuclease of predicted toxin-antitoxin system